MTGNPSADLGIILLLYVGIALFRRPGLARLGNVLAAGALAAGAGLVLATHEIHAPALLAVAVGLGAALGLIASARTTMLDIPGMVAFQHGAGGIAAFLVSAIELERGADDGLLLQGVVAGHLGLIVGAATFSASLLAAARLTGRLRSRPLALPHHDLWLLLAVVVSAALIVTGSRLHGGPLLLVLGAEGLIAMLAGLLLAVRIGGADMPVLISSLNATAGFAASFCGVILDNRLLVAFGAVVAASGSILTLVMCRAMNRSLRSVFAGFTPPPPSAVASPAGGAPSVAEPAAPAEPDAAPAEAPRERFLAWAREAGSVVIVPGYGMAVAQAQAEVAGLARWLQGRGARVRFAIHPVAGRMPGHMNVLLAEADVDYDLLVELADINRDFATTDLAIIVGACDVVNPAAIRAEGTPISGMPILLACDARNVAVFNLDATPGYSGVPNELYERPGVALLFGDARETLEGVLSDLGATA